MAGHDINMDEFDRPTGDRDDYLDDDNIADDGETSFIETPAGEDIDGATKTVALSQELLESAASDYYNYWLKIRTVPSIVSDYSNWICPVGYD